MVARENGRDGMAGVLREWVVNKDRDLRERGAGAGGNEFVVAASGGVGKSEREEGVFDARFGYA